jgi:glycosyltransferase involved in cell wall biosynthesis
MRIALIAPFAFHPKGTTHWRVRPLARALAAQGHAVRIVIPPYDWPAHSGRRWQDGGVQVVNVVVPASGGLRHAAVIAARLRRAALAWRPDIIHVFKPVGVSGLAAFALLHPDAPPVVVDADDWEGGWAAQRGGMWRQLVDWQERWVLSRADAVTVASSWLSNWVTGQSPRLLSLASKPRRVFYLPNGVERAQPAAVNPRPNHGYRVLLYTRFVEHSPAHVWAVWRRVAAARADAVLYVAGRGLHAEESTLLAMAQAAGLDSSLHLLGWAPTASRPGLFAAVDAALLPVADTPLARAKCPMRLVDLLAAGVPVATQAVGEYAAYVQDGISGLLAPADDEQALAAAVVRLLDDPELRAALADGASQRIQAHFTWRDLAKTALKAYGSVLRRPAGVQ